MNYPLLCTEAERTFGKVTKEALILIIEQYGVSREAAIRRVWNALRYKRLIEIDGHITCAHSNIPGVITEAPVKAEKKKEAEKEKIQFCKDAITYLNSVAGTKFRPTVATTTLLRARLDSGFTYEDVKRVIDLKCAQWMGTPMEKYIRPATLFNRTKFESYAGEKGKIQEDLSFNSLLED